MNLVIDQGNSVTKVAIAEAKKIIKSYALASISIAELDRILDKHPDIDAAIYSSVSDIRTDIIDRLKSRLRYTILMDNTIDVPIKVNYDRSTLGSDRLAVAVAAKHLAPQGAEVLVINTGTAITYERVSANSVYLGGNITSGLKMRFRALNHFTSRLPLVDDAVFNKDFGTNTIEAISSGVFRGTIYEMEGYIADFRDKYPNSIVIVSGGNSLLLSKYIRTKVYTIRNLVALGLNLILEYNKTKLN